MEKKSMYQLTESYRDLFLKLEYAETEDEYDAVCAEINAVDTDIEKKLDAYARFIQTKKAEVLGIKAERDRLNKLIERAENLIDHLSDIVFDTMKLTERVEVSTTIGTYRIHTNPPSVDVKDIAKIPERFLIPQDAKVDKRAILAEWKANKTDIDGVQIVRKEGLRFS